MKTFRGILLVLGLFGVQAQDYSANKNVQDLSQANTAFSLDLYKKLVKPNENLIVSGYGISTAFAMLLEGAQANTASEIRSALKYNDLSKLNLDDATKKINTALESSNEYDLSTANSVWIKDSLQVSDTYKQKLQETFNTEVKQLKTETSKVDINKWVEDKTKSAITQLLEDNLESTSVMALLNAIYFKGPWKFDFGNNSFEGTFLNNDIPLRADFPNPTTRMMQVKKQFDYVQSPQLNAQVLDLKYKGEDMSLTIILPKQGSTLAKLESELTNFRLHRVLNDLRPETVLVYLPKFKIESTLKLKDALIGLGIKDVFTESANLTGISTHRLLVSDVIQKALIDVDEKGSTAAAATAVEIQTVSIDPNLKFFNAQQPFMFFLRHKPTNTILFTGRYTNAAPFSTD